jgi:hypothetical protein
MQYFHQSQYGHIGGEHTMKPLLAMDKGHVYNMLDGRPDVGRPIYAVRDNKLFATAFHPDGVSNHALFEIKGDKVHTTSFHPAHNPDSHAFVIR